MASKAPSPQSDPNYWSPEKCRERFGSFLAADPAEIPIPKWQVELLKERMARYCEHGVHFTPWQEFEKKLLDRLKELKRLMKG
jgi:hypothetical protein